MSGPAFSAARPSAWRSPRIAVLFHRLGPYHHARLKAAARLADIVAIEFSEADATYAWDKVAGPSAIEPVTLFRDKEIDDQPRSVVMMRMARALWAAKPDVVAVPGWSSRGALAALVWCRLTGTPAVVMPASTLRDHPRQARKEFLKRQILRLASAALAGGQAQADYLALLGLPRDRIAVGYDVVDNDHFAAGAEAARQQGPALRARLGLPARYLLTSSRFIPKKNLDRLLTAFAAYRKQAGPEPWSLVVLGDGPLGPALRERAGGEGLAGAVVLPGFKQYDELPAYYGLAEAFVLASTSEQWGLVVNEAMAAGLPVLVSRNCGCVADLVKPGRNGFAFDPEATEALAALIARLAEPNCDRDAMAAASRAIIRQWSPETFAEGLLAAAEKALTRRRRRLQPATDRRAWR